VKRWLPSPLLSTALWALWLLLNETLAPGHVLLGLALALVIPWLVAPLKPPGGRLRKPVALARLVLRVGGDVGVSALQVASGVLRNPRRPPRGTFVVIPLELRDPHGLAALAIICTVIPGAIWSELAPDRSALLVHVFDLEGEQAFISHFKQRYEQPLKEIFG
jgi:multicomponent K+:H+ antiporter subunit E